MATERSLAALLRSLQSSSDLQGALNLLPTATSFLPILGNPLNVSLLASQLLVAPAIWEHPIDLQSCRKILSAFNTAAIAVLQNDAADEPRVPYGARPQRLEREEWVKAVVSGADEKSPRWRHVLLIGGMLIGFEAQDRQGLSWNMRSRIESALVTAARLALEESELGNGVDAQCITMVLNYTFELLSDAERANLDYDRLLPAMVQTTYSSSEGLLGGYFLGTIDKDIVEASGKQFKWPAQSVTFGHVSAILASPLISSLGPLSRLIAHAVENARDPAIVLQSVDHIAGFARTLMVQWRQNKLSEVDRSEEVEFLDSDSLSSTIPALWKLLRNCLYSTVIVLRAVLGRVINDRVLASGGNAPFLSMQALHVLRCMYFVSSRIGQNSTSQHVFVSLAAVDILLQYPDLAENFLRSIKPSELGQIPAHPFERCLDLFFLNTAELFTFVLPPEPSEELLISAAVPYLAAGANKKLLEIFEAAHSVVLAVFAIPQNAGVASKHLPFYIDNLFAVFPDNLSARQFRLAFRTAIKVTAPPSLLSNKQPLLPSILLEVLHERATHASTTPLPQSAQGSPATESDKTPPLSEQAALTLAMIDSLCFLRVEDLEEWLPISAQMINAVGGSKMRTICVERFWEILSNGEMDVERAHCCVTWWSTKGGRELVLFGSEPGATTASEDDAPYMSGAIGGVAPESKL